MKIIFCILGLLLNVSVFAEASSQKNKLHSKIECPKGQHFVRAHPRSEYITAKGKYYSATNVSSSCRANPPSYEEWHKKLKNGVPSAWQMKKEKPQKWLDDEKEMVLDALSELPIELLVDTVEGIYRLDKFEKEPKNPAAGYGDSIALYNKAFDTKQNLTRILAHEFAHKLYRQFYDTDKGVEYSKVAEWEAKLNPKNKDLFLMTWRDDFVEEDGKNGPDEDFSNNIEYFLFEPKTLKNKNPKIYEWIQKKYSVKFKMGAK